MEFLLNVFKIKNVDKNKKG